MKRSVYSIIASYFSLFGLAIVLQGCFVWETAVYWRSAGPSEAIARQQTSLEIHKRQGFFLLPFLCVTYGVGGYRIDFTMYNEKIFYGIDSVRYNITNKNRQVYSSSLVPKVYYINTKGLAKDLKKIRIGTDTIKRVGFSTQLQDFAIAKGAESVKVDFDIFKKDSSGRVQIIKYNNCQLMREGRKFGSLL